MEVLVDESGRRSIDRAVNVEGGVEQSAFERLPCLRVPARYLFGPSVSLVGEEREGMIVADVDLEARQQLTHDGLLVDACVPETRPRQAALDEERPACIVPRDEPYGAATVPALECVGLAMCVDVRRGVQLEDDLPCRDNERARRVDRRLELE
jgi:hypothetical protein